MTSPSAADCLPDEIIREFLAPALDVPEYKFSDTGYLSPFSTYELTTSTALLVCKTWLRVATPLLYHTVVLRSRAQAQALAEVLKSKDTENPTELNLFVKRIRLEGWYGTAAGHILEQCTNLTHLWIPFTLRSNESIAGYAKGFAAINPSKLILLEGCGKGRRAKIEEKGRQLLKDAMKAWRNLVHFHYCSDHGRSFGSFLPVLASDVETIFLEDRHSANEAIFSFQMDNIAFYYSKLSLYPKLKEIRTTTFEKDLRAIAGRHASWSPILKDKKFCQKIVLVSIVPQVEDIQKDNQEPTPPTVLPTPITLGFTPMAKAQPRAQYDVWMRTIRHALGYYELERQYTRESISGLLPLNGFPFLLISRYFFEITRRIIRQIMPISSPHILKSVGNAPALSHVGYLCIDMDNLTKGHKVPDDGIAASIGVLLPGCHNLKQLVTPRTRRYQEFFNNIGQRNNLDVRSGINWGAFKSFATWSGTELDAFHVPIHANVDDADGEGNSKQHEAPGIHSFIKLVTRFLKIRSLMLSTDVLFSDFAKARPPLGSKLGGFGPALLFVENLGILHWPDASTGALLECLGYTFMPSLSRLDLPALSVEKFGRHVIWLLWVHGYRLETIQIEAKVPCLFDFCHSVRKWIIPPPLCLTLPFDIACLQTSTNWPFKRKLEEIHLPACALHFDVLEPLIDFDFSQFPFLKEIRIAVADLWPRNEDTIRSSIAVRFAEALLEKGIKITDKNGVGWTPRLKRPSVFRASDSSRKRLDL